MSAHVGDIRHTFGDGDPRQAGAVKDNPRSQQKSVEAAIYRATDDWDERRALMEMLFAPLNPTRIKSRTGRREVWKGNA